MTAPTLVHRWPSARAVASSRAVAAARSAASPGRDRAATGATDTADRRTGQIIAVGGVLLAAGAVGTATAQWAGLAPWWQAAGVVLVATALVLSVLGPTLPPGTVRTVSWAFPALSLLLLATWAAARTQAGLGADGGPWVWRLEPAAVAFAALAWPVWCAVAYSQVSALAVLAAALAADGRVSRGLVLAVLAHLGTVAVVLIVTGTRRRSAGLRRDDERAAGGEAVRARTRANEAERSRLAAVVHDQVLATLAVAAQSEGAPGASLADQARRALTVLRAVPVDPSVGPLPAEALVTALSARVRRLGPTVVVQAHADAVDIPQEVADAVLAALDEAVRNSLRHAGDPGRRRPVSRRVDVTVDDRGLRVVASDDGVGFDPGALDPRRLGVRRSILERMSTVPGATAQVWSRPGSGTRVELGWLRP